MYELVEKEDVITELNAGAKLYVVDIPTFRVMECQYMTLQAVKSFIDKPSSMFFKEVANE